MGMAPESTTAARSAGSSMGTHHSVTNQMAKGCNTRLPTNDDIALGLFFGGEVHVPVVGCACNHFGQASAANAFGTRKRHVVTRVLQHFQDGLVFAD
jgi:hypothetical protein